MCEINAGLRWQNMRTEAIWENKQKCVDMYTTRLVLNESQWSQRCLVQSDEAKHVKEELGGCGQLLQLIEVYNWQDGKGTGDVLEASEEIFNGHTWGQMAFFVKTVLERVANVGKLAMDVTEQKLEFTTEGGGRAGVQARDVVDL